MIRAMYILIMQWAQPDGSFIGVPTADHTMAGKKVKSAQAADHPRGVPPSVEAARPRPHHHQLQTDLRQTTKGNGVLLRVSLCGNNYQTVSNTT